MQRLSQKVAIVTGASKGIGAGIAKSLAAQGAYVVVNYAGGKDGADKVVADILAKDGRAVAVQADVSKPADVKRLFAETKRAFGKLDILVNNAGVFQFDPLAEVTEAEYRRQFDINVLGTILTIQESLNLFGPEGGSVINLGSVVSKNPPPASAVYSATKGAVDTLSRALAVELAPRKIRVNVVAPGLTESEGTHRVGIIGSEFEKNGVANTPLARVGQPDDIAKVVAFLASDDAGWITGDRVTASGGFA